MHPYKLEYIQVKVEQELAAMHERLSTSERQLEEARPPLNAVFASRFWRITVPLRNVRSKIHHPTLY